MIPFKQAPRFARPTFTERVCMGIAAAAAAVALAGGLYPAVEARAAVAARTASIEDRVRQAEALDQSNAEAARTVEQLRETIEQRGGEPGPVTDLNARVATLAARAEELGLSVLGVTVSESRAADDAGRPAIRFPIAFEARGAPSALVAWLADMRTCCTFTAVESLEIASIDNRESAGAVQLRAALVWTALNRSNAPGARP